MSDYTFNNDNEPYENYIPVNAPYLELVLSNRIGCGIRKGTVCRFKGEPASGKSMFAMHILGACAKDPRTKDYQLIYIDKENGISGFDIESRFGKEASERIEYVPSMNAPNTIETIHSKIREYCNKAPSIIVVDSMDTLLSDKEEALVAEADKLRSEGKAVPDPPLMLGPRASSHEWKVTNPVVASTGSVLFLISQTRKTPSIYAGAFNTSGGQALEFYSSIVLGFKSGTPIKRKDRYGTERIVGFKTEIIPTKNRQTGLVKEASVCNFYTPLGFVSAEDVFDFLSDRVNALKKGGAGYYGCDWLDTEKGDVKLRKNEWIKRFMHEPDLYERALSRMEGEWKNISADYSDIF